MSQQQVALVSGANRGIGREIARQLSSQHGFLVLAGARDPGRGDLDGSVVAVALDVTDAASVDAALSSIAADPGRLDVLVNNAGVEGPPDGAGEVDLAEVHAVLETNLFGAWRLVQAAVPLLRRSSDARIVNISSGMGQLAKMGGRYSAYRISKAGLNALTRGLAAEEPGIRADTDGGPRGRLLRSRLAHPAVGTDDMPVRVRKDRIV
jgi:NAD(P)-dependent dehydrogenase (short-subunit alcohol dehydrogenase family)